MADAPSPVTCQLQDAEAAAQPGAAPAAEAAAPDEQARGAAGTLPYPGEQVRSAAGTLPYPDEQARSAAAEAALLRPAAALLAALQRLLHGSAALPLRESVAGVEWRVRRAPKQGGPWSLLRYLSFARCRLCESCCENAKSGNPQYMLSYTVPTCSASV